MSAEVCDTRSNQAPHRRLVLVVSCEHAGRHVPDAYAGLFTSERARAALESHRGWDPGAEQLAELFAQELGAPLVSQEVSRLLVECNRSIGHPALWSEFSRSLPDDRRDEVLARFWRPHRDAVRRLVGSFEASAEASVSGGAPHRTPPVAVHVGVHTFTPVWRSRRRTTDIGILHDPGRAPEARVARLWRDGLVSALVGDRSAASAMNVHLNRPYRGWTDGLATSLRAEFPPERYLGFELEVSQAIVPLHPRIVTLLAESLLSAVERVPLG